MMSKEYAPKQMSLISLKYGIFLTCNHWILSTSFSYENFPFIKKYFILYFTSDSYAAMTLSIDKVNDNVER